MRIKVFRAPTLRGAITLLRDELGPDALLLSSREGQGEVEVTAAVEPEDALHDDLEHFDDVPPPLPPALLGAFVWHNLPPILVDKLTPRGQETLAGACGRRFQFESLFNRIHGDTLLFCGPQGSGRTTSVVAAANACLLAGDVPIVVTSDSRPGAPETLAAAMQTLGVTLIVADRAETLAKVMARRPPSTTLLIDTPPLDPFNATSAALDQLARGARARPILVMPAGIDPLEAAEFTNAAVERINTIDRLLITRFHESGRLGGPLAACVTGGLALAAAVSAAAGGLPQLLPLSAENLSQRLEQRRGVGNTPSAGAPVTGSPSAGATTPPVRQVEPRLSPGFARNAAAQSKTSHRHAALLIAHIAAQSAHARTC